MPRIVVIDDEQPIREMLRQYLSGKGFEVLTASNGEEGLKIVSKQSVDLVITDLIMPDKEGLETIIELKSMWPEAKVIAISGGGINKPEDYLETARTLGAAEVLAKPFNNSDLLRAVRKVIGDADV